MVLRGSLETVFCEGLDLTELHVQNTDRLPKHWESFQQVHIDLHGSRLATVAAMPGHAPAAGCMLAPWPIPAGDPGFRVTCVLESLAIWVSWSQVGPGRSGPGRSRYPGYLT
jgi:hypothetical protein